MNKFFTIAFLGICLSVFTPLDNLFAQQNHFVYIQSATKVPFTVSVNGKTYHSSSVGYVIVPKLTSGKYQFTIAFANKKYPDQQFNCIIDKNDKGFSLTDYGDKGWGLYNMQTLDITMAGAPAVPETAANNAFGNMLAQVIDDSTLNTKTAQAKAQEAEKAKVAVVDTIKTIPQFATTSLVKIDESATNEGRYAVFVDNTNGLNDTIHIFYPAPEQSIPTAHTTAALTDTLKATNTPPTQPETLQQTLPVEDKKEDGVNNPFFTKDNPSAPAQPAVAVNNTQVSSQAPTVAGNSEAVNRADCKTVIGENDMDKLRKKMVSASTGDKMIAVAQKYISGKCITTSQVKNLGALFLSDDGRLQFFSAAYPSVYDISLFPTLESQLIGSDYKQRFREILK